MKMICILAAASIAMAVTAAPVSAREAGDGPRFERPERETPAARPGPPERPDRPDTTGERFAKKGATAAGRAAAGAAIGGTVGNIIRGGWIGSGIGTFLSPTQTGCAALHGC